MRIDVWTDLVCPWCYLGKRRLELVNAAEHRDVDSRQLGLEVFFEGLGPHVGRREDVQARSDRRTERGAERAENGHESQQDCPAAAGNRSRPLGRFVGLVMH